MSINSITEEDIELFEAHGNLRSYQRIATKSAIYPGLGTPLGLAYCALKLNGEAGELAEHVGKAMRDDNLMRGRDDDEPGWHSASEALTQERKHLLIKEVGDVLWYLSAICNELDLSLSEAALINLKKLRDRIERGKLQGSGDER